MDDDVRAWLARRRRVSAYEREEARRMTVEDRLEALASLMASVDALGLRQELERGDDAIWTRWNALRWRLGGR